MTSEHTSHEIQTNIYFRMNYPFKKNCFIRCEVCCGGTGCGWTREMKARLLQDSSLFFFFFQWREVNGGWDKWSGVSKGNTLKPDKIEDSSNVAGRWRQAKKTLCVLVREGWMDWFLSVCLSKLSFWGCGSVEPRSVFWLLHHNQTRHRYMHICMP